MRPATKERKYKKVAIKVTELKNIIIISEKNTLEGFSKGLVVVRILPANASGDVRDSRSESLGLGRSPGGVW